VIELDKNRMLVRQQRLQKFGRILSRRYKLNIQVKNIKSYGCTDSTNMILIRADINKDDFVNLIIQKTMVLHEIGHVLYTKNKLWNNTIIDKGLINIIEDGRVEENISRKYPKARIYFIFTNQKLLQFEKKEPLNLKVLTMELIFREAKKTTGTPQLPPEIHQYLKDELKDDYKWLLNKTRKAVETKNHSELLALTIQIDNKLNKLFPKQNIYEKFPKVTNSPIASIDNCGNTSLKVPNLSKQEEELVKELEKQLEKKSKDKKEEKQKEQKEEVKGTGDGEEEKGKGTGTGDLILSIEEDLKNEAKNEIQQETETLSSGVVDKDFSLYGDEAEWYWGRSEKPISTTNIEPIAKRIAHLFKTIAQSGDGWSHNQTRGKLEMHKITTLLTSTEQPRVFKRKQRKENIDLSVAILLDASGSMQHMKYKATKSAYIMSKALELGNYKSEVVQFFGHGKNFIGLKSFNQRLDYAKNEFKPMGSGGTPLLNALKGADKSLSRLDSNRKLVMVVTDGRPNKTNLCKKKIREMEKKGIIVIGLLLGYRDWHGIFNPKHKLSCKEVEELPPKMTGVIKEVLMTIKRG